MRISEQWLREWVNPPVSTAELAAQLTMAGLEVDSVTPVAPPLERVVVGRVLALAPHPQAERLQVAQVDVGQAEPLQIVCGAANVAVGLLAPVALAGAVLADGQTIAPAERRGVPSQGMLCSARELGLADSADGLLVLPADSPPGMALRDWLKLDDQVIEVDLTPNRGDCLGMLGIAREVGVLNRCAVNEVPADPVPAVLEATFPVTVTAPADCPRYAGRVIRQVNPAAETPLWLRERLRRADLRPLGPLVDVTNYVLLELGQPLHAFDVDRLHGGIEVRRARPGETLALLNGTTVEPDSETLLIADQSGPLALAGIMGGIGSAVDEQTVNVFLESAFFAPTTIAGRARRYGLHTDASHRFERGVDPQLQVRALERATRLLLEIAGGQPGPLIEVAANDQLPAATAIRLRPERIEQLLGLTIKPAAVTEMLTRLGMAVAADGDHWLVVPPSFRFDITLEADLIEEIGRIYGYSRLPSRRPLTRLEFTPQPEAHLSLDRLREALVQRGFQEAITYSFVDPVFQQALDPARTALALANPIAADLAVMRTSLWPALLKAVVYNQKRQQSRIRLFETGLVYLSEGDTLEQVPRLGGVIAGEAQEEQWGLPRRTVDFFDLKAEVEALLALTGRADDWRCVAARHPALHPGQSARLERDGGVLGWLGALHPALGHQLEVEGPVFLFELEAELLCTGRVPQFAELSRFPASRRDLAVVVDEAVTAQALLDSIRARGGELLRDVWLFDVYRGPSLPEGRKSLAFGLILQDFSRNLRDATVEQIMADITAGLAQQFGATLRV